MNSLLKVEHLTKRYKNFTLQDISFEIPEGFICGYVGPNGAGKTTTLDLSTHLRKASEGEAYVGGLRFRDDPVEYRNRIGYIGDSAYFPREFTPKMIRSVLKDFYPSFDPDRFVKYCDAWELKEKQKVKEMSRGTIVKLMFAAVLSRDSRLLILDEATNGLDPVVRRDVLHLLQEYIADGKHSVLFSTHIMEDLQGIADYIFLLDRGKKVLFEAKDDLQEQYLMVRCGRGDLTEEVRSHLIGVDTGEFGISALFPTDANVILPSGILTEKPSIDEIVVHLLSERKRLSILQ